MDFIAVLIFMGGLLIGLGAKNYSVVIGNVDKARLQWFTVVTEKKTITAECYWELVGVDGKVLGNPQKTATNKVFDTKPGKADLKRFLANELMDHIDVARSNFTDSVVE
jgi:hypothetical protein